MAGMDGIQTRARIPRKGYNPVLAACIAMDAQKSVAQNSAFEKCPQLPLYEPKNRALTFALYREIRINILGDNAARWIIPGITGTIFAGHLTNQKAFIPCDKGIAGNGSPAGNGKN